MAAVAGLGGTILAWWGVDVFARTSPAVIPSGRNYYAAIGSLGAPALDPVVLCLRPCRRPGHDSGVRARARARGVATGARDGAQRGRSRRRPPRHSLSILVVIEVAIASLLLTGSGLLDRGLRAHSEPPSRLRVRRRVDVLGAASRLAVPRGVGPGDGRPAALAHPGRARRRVGGRQSMHAVQRLLENDPVPARPSDRSCERAWRRPSLRVRRLLPHARHPDPRPDGR